MPPTEQPIQIAKLLVQLVVFGRADEDRFHQPLRTLPNRVGQRANSCIGTDSLAVHHARIEEFARDPVVSVNPGYHQRPKEITFPALVHAEMRLEHFGRVHFFIPKLGFAQNFRLEFELHELLDAAALHQHFWSLLINRHAQLVLLRKKNRPLLRSEFEP